MAEKGYSIGQIARRMNQELKSIMPINRFVAVTLLLVDFENNVIEIWNGGNPPVFVVNENKEVEKRFDSKHLALGILPDEKFDARTDFLSCEGNSAVVLYSDGLIEAENSDGQIFDENMLMDVMKTDSNAVRLRNNIVEAVSNHLDETKAHDDMSLIVLNTQRS
jgi:serine phosphatase RsbU (regulator of sigma subunit)